MGKQSYDITRYQPVLFAAESIDALEAEMSEFLDHYDDESFERLSR